MSRQMTEVEIARLFNDADMLMIKFIGSEERAYLRQVNHELFNDFATVAQRELEDVFVLGSDLRCLEGARLWNEVRDQETPSLNRRECISVIVCAAALAARMK